MLISPYYGDPEKAANFLTLSLWAKKNFRAPVAPKLAVPYCHQLLLGWWGGVGVGVGGLGSSPTRKPSPMGYGAILPLRC